MQEVSECVKRILDETFTTYPWDKVTNYVSKISAELCISIIVDRGQYPNPPEEWLNDTYFDDKRYLVYSLVKNKITEDITYFENIKNSLQLIGLNYSKSYFMGDKEILIFLPKKQNSINMSVFGNMNYLYHVCPRYVTEKIVKNGFVPKAKNNIFAYDPRIHFFFPSTPLANMQMIRKQLDDNNDSIGNTHEYDLIKIKTPDNVTFYKDLDCEFGLYTNENIGPENIIDIKPIDGITVQQYAEWELKNIFGIL